MTALADLLIKLDPAEVIDGPEQRADFALNTYPLANAPIDSCQDFLHFMTLFNKNVKSCVNDFWPYYDYAWMHREVVELFESLFGQDGASHAHIIAQSGIDGGLYGLMKQIAKHAVSDYRRRVIDYAVDDFLTGLNCEKTMEAFHEYLDRYRDYIPPELIENNGWGIKTQFEQLLRKHPYMIRNLSIRI